MKSVIIGALLIAAAQTTLMAQRGHHRIPMDVLRDSLELSEAQVSRLEQVRADTREQMKTLRADDSIDRDAFREAMRKILGEAKEKRDEVLTDEQRGKLEKMHADRPHRLDRGKRMSKGDRKARRGERRARMHEKRAAVRQYRQENIRPVMLAQRAKLEAVLSVQDKQKVEDLRSRVKARKAEARARRERMREAGNRPDRGTMQKWREEHRDSEEMREARALTEKYQDAIQALLDEVKGKREQWRSDIREIMKPEKGGEFRKQRHRRHHRMKGHGSHKPGEMEGSDAREERREMRALHRKVRFLLLDPDTPDNGHLGQAGNRLIRDVEVYPNPAATVSNVSFVLNTSGRVGFEIRDESGYPVKEIPARPFESGQVTVRLDLDGIPTGAYSIVILPEKGVRHVARIVINQ